MTTYSDATVADNLRGQRAKRRMTQQEVAESIGVSISTVTNWEAGKGGMSFENAWKLADLFECGIGELFGRDEQKHTVWKGEKLA